MRLLIVEDNQTLARSVRQGLQEEGFAVDVAADGEEGLWYAQSNPYDVIVLDLTLPKLDGLELLRQIRKLGIASHVICLTARGATEDKVHALNLAQTITLRNPSPSRSSWRECVRCVAALIREKTLSSASETWRSIRLPEPSAEAEALSSYQRVNMRCLSSSLFMLGRLSPER